MTAISVISTSNAADLGYLALADVAASGLDPRTYRIVGGHMVQLLIHVYPTPEATERSTADADAGIDRATAVGQDLHLHLLGSGYEATSGNRYVKKDPAGGERAVDLLIPHGTVGEPEQVNGRGFDAIPGLGFALTASPLLVDAKVLLRNGTDMEFTVPVPNVESALILKALAWKSRASEKDLTDISSLLEITQRHKVNLSGWGFDDSRRAERGSRKDAAFALHLVRDRLERGFIKAGAAVRQPARLSALINAHIPSVR
ncbi:hypothetical protein OOZ51_14270 [Arthrobacter sp. MI7-26]|uniref:hypothetical protein n=1 Tax=Arthrobacter sp. MI7-26 TaxID=2993653 RepID=UPI002249200F|nr:hypothetical protein [Arthrobacter sp. MI7-26]MCX2748970.1 hypothetical protein [Arthrobacter sp. MI7-26]